MISRAYYDKSRLFLRLVVTSLIVSNVACFANCIETLDGHEFVAWFVAIAEHGAIGGQKNVIGILGRFFTKLEMFNDPVALFLGFESG